MLIHQLKKQYDTKVICLTPYRDERWMLHRFLSCALLWADMVILGDNCSEQPFDDILDCHDRTRIKVVKVDMGGFFNESAMRKPMLDAAREIPGKKLLTFLDADEVYSAEIFDSHELHSLFSIAPGNVATSDWVQLGPYVRHGSTITRSIVAFLMDDGVSEYNMDKKFHGLRVPGEANVHKWDILRLNDISILHYADVDLLRKKIKNFWYQCHEWLLPDRKPLPVILRQYYFRIDRDDAYTAIAIPEKVFSHYISAGIDMTSVNKLWYIWQEKQVLDFFIEHGVDRFDLLDIWDHDWERSAGKYDMKLSALHRRRRSLMGRLIRYYIRVTHQYSSNALVKRLDYYLGKWLG